MYVMPKTIGKSQSQGVIFVETLLILYAEEGYYRSQAGLLAEALEEGMPCPVCGSLSHPSPARLAAEAVTKAELEAAEARRREAEDALNEADRALLSVRAAVEANTARLKEMDIPGDETEQRLEARVRDMEARAAGIRDKIEKSRRAYADLTVRVEKSRTVLDEGQRRLSSLQETFRRQETQFRERLALAGFADEAAYRTAKLPHRETDEIEKRLKEYGEKRQSLADRISALREKLIGKTRADLPALEEELLEWKQKRETAEKAEAALAKKLALHQDALREIRDARGQQKRKEKYRAVVRDLYNCCAGITGGYYRAKLTFEAYVQQYYFRQVVAAANLRLTVLTDGMFILRCKEEAKDRVRQSGLDLDVLDRGTGLWRDVSTLSGGESFLASLALALGLSDTVQGRSGAVRMEAMFIDEGFGTLDDTALRNSLRVLSGLADGKRLIGIISHVRDLEERIEKQIVVTKTPKGSKIELLT